MFDVTAIERRSYATTMRVERLGGVLLGGRRRADLEVTILGVHGEPQGAYGAPRITTELHDLREIITANTAAKIMRSLGIVHARSGSARMIDPLTSVDEAFPTPH